MQTIKLTSKFLLSAYGSATIILFDLVGRLMLSEVIALVNLPFINLRKLINNNEGLKNVLVSLLILLIALVISDIINETDSVNYLRGWATIIFAMISMIFFLHHLSINPNNIIFYLFALFIFRMIFGEGELNLYQWEIDTNYFKVRFVGFLNPFIILISYYLYKKNKRLLANIIILIFGLLCISLDARSNGLIFIVSSFFLLLNTKKLKLTKKRVLSFGFAALLLLYGGYILYVNQVLYNGFGGTTARVQLSMASNPYNPFELLYFGRMEIIISLEAISEKPIFGYGSWANDKTSEFARYTAQLRQLNYIPKRDFIPSHSLIFTAWLYAGIIGFLVVIYMFVYLFKKSIRIFIKKKYDPILPIVMILSIDMLWAMFFSPFGHLRLTFPLYASLIIILYQRTIPNTP